ncbi:rhomboid family intramembrane serine protease [Jeotgalibaca ciconiae]|uniref:Rhomboid family intramembrane serine protease n=1 Tax=Jeotgalibaca ciconiae TaxID=2496265 RepID=A0A3Q9BMD1_9LACT|nr:rhomboid family intramembrane serine protease [Jeotgalibaca ciconiae]AZP05260.1 rhomboid family intramembrane serine protease [Jeotgalibaca ciconiae]HJB22988.1 rhomboid family intramembrane serine protease [Candidatus Jeotgalibaca pullicola]
MENFSIRRKFRKKRIIMTYLFLGIQVIAFLLMTFMGGSQNTFTLYIFGAKVNEAIVMGEIWRLITPIFLHIGFMHLLINSITLYYLGSQLELTYGSIRFAIIYLLGGFMGNAMSFAFTPAISAGASTSLFGLFAATVVLGRLYPHNYAIRNMAQGFLILIVINFISGLTSSSIDNWGHLGGAMGGGLAACFIMIPNLAPIEKNIRIKMLIAYLLLAILFIAIGFRRFGMI